MTTLIGDNKDNSLYAYDPSFDLIYGKGGDDVIDAGGHNDTVYAGAGDDLIFAGSQVYHLILDDDRVYGGTGNDTIYGHTFYGGEVVGDNDIDTLNGGAGNDVITGTGHLIGGAGDDVITSRGERWGGPTYLNGGAGNDRLMGSDQGQDYFIFKPGYDKDIIRNFNSDHDVIDLRAFDLSYTDATKAMRETATGDVVFNFGDGDVLRAKDVGISDIAIMIV